MTDRPVAPVRAYFGHHKCASTWINQILSRVAIEFGLRYLFVVDDQTPQGVGALRDRASLTEVENEFERSELRAHVDRTAADVVGCVTADREQAEVLQPYRGFHVVRDPRDVIVSAYFSHRNSHPTDNVPHLAAHREALRGVSKQDGLFLEMEHSKTELRQMEAWDYGDERILEVKMERLTTDPFGTFIEIFRHLELLSDEEPVTAREQANVWMSRLGNRLSRRRGLGSLQRRLPVSGEMLLGTVYAQRFEAQTGGRTRGSEDAGSHYRKGVAGDWAGHFTREHAVVFDQEFGDLLVKLGYEQDDEWVSRYGWLSVSA